ncbi:MAG: membrane protein insertion efficiency factor YidD [Lachnospiraceae bacterium]|nr:membrane protein insertion efficiency factor YidD [Lachnospiraceae bacterium]
MKKIILFLIKLYKKYISPLKGTKCPYFPSCSQYGYEAVERHGALIGGFLAFWRILRCNPFSKGGYDYVPETIGRIKSGHPKMKKKYSEKKISVSYKTEM